MWEESRVSVIMPCFNNDGYVAQAIRSVIGQTYTDWELIVVDDASTDGSQGMLAQFAGADPRIRVIRHAENRGAAAARNTALAVATGRFLAFLDADDLWDSIKLERQVSAMVTHGWAFSFAAYRIVDERGARVGTLSIPASLTYQELLEDTIIGCLTVVLDRQGVGDIRFPDLRKRQDLALWLSLLRPGRQAHGIQEELASYRITPGSLSRNKLLAAAQVWRVYRDLEKLTIVEAMNAFLGYASHAMAKHHPWFRPLAEVRDLVSSRVRE